ncbi:MAG: hypothetical protein CW349_10510 [Firmicutes bacterium]|nr:hypothetical protein [Bacillota bacterium]
MGVPNELLWFGFMILDLTIVLALYWAFGRSGLYTAVITGTIVSNVQVVKTVTLFGLEATLGNITYASIFLATDMLNERYGKREALRGVALGFAALVSFTIAMQYALLVKPAPSDFAHPAMTTLFTLLPRVVAASLAAYLISNVLDVHLFQFIRQRTGGRHLWLRKNGSTWISQAVDSTVFVLGAFAGVLPWAVMGEIVVTTFLLKAVVAAIDTVFMYIAVRIRPRSEAPPLPSPPLEPRPGRR